MSYFPTSVRSDNIPVQMIQISEKNAEWKKANLDAFESIGRKQFLENINILENYRMVNNEMLYNHYVFSDSVTDLAQLAVKEFDLPPYLRHYDMINKVINVLCGEYQKRPDIFRVQAIDEWSDNEYLRTKKEMLHDGVMGQIQNTIKMKLMQEGLNPDKQDFKDDDEKQKYIQQLQEETQKFTPEYVEQWMKQSYRGQGEKWGEQVINLDKQRFNTPELEMVEFRDVLICDRTFRHFYLKANGLGYNMERWNPIRVFFHKSPDTTYVDDGDYVGRVFYLSIPEIIARYGYKMSKKQMEDLYGDYLRKKKFGGAEYSFFQATNVPFENYPEYARTVQAFGFDPHTGTPFTGGAIGNFTGQDVDVLFNSSSTTYNLQGLTLATEAYWRSQKKVGFLLMQDPETGETIEEIVDENFQIPDGVTEVDDDPTYEDFVYYPQKKMNTIRWTWVDEVWGGIKINALNSETPGGMYLDIKPLQFQFKGDIDPYACKLPVCGAMFNNANAKSMSLVDMMKPYQILYNVFYNRVYQLASTEIGKILLLNPKLIPNDKDWGGERNLEKWRTIAREYKIGQIDTSDPKNLQANGMNWSVQDLREFDNIKANLEICKMIEDGAMYQIGITNARLGNVQASETATGVQQSINNSYAQTESYFTKFSNYKRRCLQMNLDIAQFCSATNRDITLSLIQDDMSRAFIQMNGTELLNKQLGIIVFSSQEILRQTEMMKQLVLTNNTTNTPLSTLFEVIYTASPARIIEITKEVEAKMVQQAQDQRQTEQEQAQQALEAKQKLEEMKFQFEAEQNQLNRENQIQLAMIKSEGYAETKAGDPGVDKISQQADIALKQSQLEFEKAHKTQELLHKNLDGIRKQSLEKQKMSQEKDIKDKEIAIKEKEIQGKKQLEDKKSVAEKQKVETELKIAKENHGHDVKMSNKDLESKKKELHNQKELHTLKKKEGEHKLEIQKKLGEDKVKTQKKLSLLKIAASRKIKTKK